MDNRNGDVYVADYYNHRIQKFTSTGQYLTKWGKANCATGTGEGEFNKPAGVAVDRDGSLYVADTENHRIQKFAADGTFLTKWGKADCKAGSGEEEFNKSNGVALDGAGNVFVTDKDNGRIQKLAHKGAQSVTSGLEAGRSYDIYAVAEDSNGNLQSQPTKVEVTMEPPPAPAAPTNPVVNDAANTFGWTNVSGFDNASDYEYSVDSGTTWNDCTSNPQDVGDYAYDTGAVQVRVKADSATGRPSGAVLVSNQPYTTTPQKVATPTADPSAGAVTAGTQVALICTTAGATIYYTTDGSDPTTSSTEYTTPIAIDTAVTIKANATKAGMDDSDILTAVYNVLSVDNVFVSPNGDDGNVGDSWETAKLTIKNGINSVNAGGTVNIADGAYSGENNRNISIGKNMTIKGQSKSGTVIDGNNAARIFTVQSGSDVTIQDLTVRNGTSNYGGAVYNNGTLTLVDSAFASSTATGTGGGAIYNASGLEPGNMLRLSQVSRDEFGLVHRTVDSCRQPVEGLTERRIAGGRLGQDGGQARPEDA